MLPSGNDAANELAYWMSAYLFSSTDPKFQLKTFVGEMNKNAQLLSLNNTKFGNPHGLPSQ
jgi:D-alanyl-D-alanine carboxypeptidase